MTALAFMVLGFFLGMRHATDPDHVIAVTIIVAREKSRSGATAIGAAWGLGHTLTILVVGGGIIVFGWVIPPRVGARLGSGLRIASGVISLGFGLFVAYRTGFADGLFTGTPKWTPQ